MYKLIKFEKYHGLGNDFIIINIDELIQNNILEVSYSDIAKKICQRNTGVGADGCIFLKKISQDICEMIFFNQDGTRASMCGNGIRCFSHYIEQNKILDGKIYKILTGSGLLHIEIIDVEKFKCRVNMGKPDYKLENIPLAPNELIKLKEDENSKFFHTTKPHLNIIKDQSIHCTLEIDNKKIELDSLFMGTTHGVTFLKKLENFPIEEIGKKIEVYPLFPKKTNVNFVEIIDRKNINLKTWERGAGLTFACGTGASASVVVGALKYNLLDKIVTVHLPKGTLEIEITDNMDVFMTGPSEKICKGVYRYERN